MSVSSGSSSSARAASVHTERAFTWLSLNVSSTLSPEHRSTRTHTAVRAADHEVAGLGEERSSGTL